MILNPYQFKRFLRTPALRPHWTGWGVFILAATGTLMAAFPYMAPASVAIDLPGISASAHPQYATAGALAIVNGQTIIFGGELLDQKTFEKRLAAHTDKSRLLLVAGSATTLKEILPIMTAAENLGFAKVSFVIKP